MNMRTCVLLGVSSALVACGLFDASEEREVDAVPGEQGASEPDEPDDIRDVHETDSTDGEEPTGAERDGGPAPETDAERAPVGDRENLSEGGTRAIVDASFGWAADGAIVRTHDASASVRDGGLIKFDPDASGPVLNPEAQAACIGLLNNVCGRSADCQVSLLGLEPAQGTRLFESCRNSLWRARNCNRATRTESAFAQCSESTKSVGCITVLTTDLAATCADQISLQP